MSDWRPIETLVPPTGLPAETAKVRDWLKVNGAGQDAVIEALIKAATRYIENMTGLRLLTQTVMLRRSCFTNVMRLPIGPVQSIEAVEYLDASGATQALDADVYEGSLIGQRPKLTLASGKSWPSTYSSPEAVRITAVVGFGDVQAQPDDIRTALMMLCAQWFDTRAASSEREQKEVPLAVWSLLNPYYPQLVA